MNGKEVEQVFFKRQAGRIEALLVLVAFSGALQRERIYLDSAQETEAAKRLGFLLAHRADIDSVDRVRFRVERRGSLEDDGKLKKLFQEAFWEYFQEDERRY